MTRRFYDALKEALEVTGWSIPKLCAEAGVSKDQITKFMQRAAKGQQASTNIDDAVKLAHALGMTIDQMLQDDSAALRSDAVAQWQQLTPEARAVLLDLSRVRSAQKPS